MKPKDQEKQHRGKDGVSPAMYSTNKKYSTLIAARYPVGDGTPKDTNPRNSLLYRTKLGAYFISHETTLDNELESLEPVDVTRAKQFFYELPVQLVDYWTAFPPDPVPTTIPYA